MVMMMPTINNLIQLGKDEDGYLEKKTNAYLYDKKKNAGYNNYTKYAYELDQIQHFFNGKKNGFAWCSVFVAWLFVKTFGEERAKQLLNYPYDSCGAGVYWAKLYFTQKGQYYKYPERGDCIFFRNASGGMQHIGLVYDSDSKYVYTIEGNTSGGSVVVAEGGAVCLKKYSLNNYYIDGYGRPSYTEEEKGGKLHKEMYVYNTDWEGLNVRETPNGKILGLIPVGTKVMVSEISGQWSHIEQGWVFSAYLSKTKPDVRVVTSDVLNLRKGPGTKYAIVGRLNKGTRVQVFKTNGSWVKVSPTANAWCSKNYLKKV